MLGLLVGLVALGLSPPAAALAAAVDPGVEALASKSSSAAATPRLRTNAAILKSGEKDVGMRGLAAPESPAAASTASPAARLTPRGDRRAATAASAASADGLLRQYSWDQLGAPLSSDDVVG